MLLEFNKSSSGSPNPVIHIKLIKIKQNKDLHSCTPPHIHAIKQKEGKRIAKCKWLYVLSL